MNTRLEHKNKSIDTPHTFKKTSQVRMKSVYYNTTHLFVQDTISILLLITGGSYVGLH